MIPSIEHYYVSRPSQLCQCIFSLVISVSQYVFINLIKLFYSHRPLMELVRRRSWMDCFQGSERFFLCFFASLWSRFLETRSSILAFNGWLNARKLIFNSVIGPHCRTQAFWHRTNWLFLSFICFSTRRSERKIGPFNFFLNRSLIELDGFSWTFNLSDKSRHLKLGLDREFWIL